VQLVRPVLLRPSAGARGVAAEQSESVDRRRPLAKEAARPGPRIAAQSAAKDEGEGGGVVRTARWSATSAATMSPSVGTCRRARHATPDAFAQGRVFNVQGMSSPRQVGCRQSHLRSQMHVRCGARHCRQVISGQAPRGSKVVTGSVVMSCGCTWCTDYRSAGGAHLEI
jgi:hypothetical protein